MKAVANVAHAVKVPVGWSDCCTELRRVMVNPRIYQQIARFVLDFFDLLFDDAKVVKPGAS